MTAHGHRAPRRRPDLVLPRPRIGLPVSVTWREDQIAAINAFAEQRGVSFSAAARVLMDTALRQSIIISYEAQQSPPLPRGSLTDEKV